MTHFSIDANMAMNANAAKTKNAVFPNLFEISRQQSLPHK